MQRGSDGWVINILKEYAIKKPPNLLNFRI